MIEVEPGAIRVLLIEAGLLAANADIAESQSLFDAGVLDSLRLIDFVLTIESSYGIAVRSDELIPENFDSIASLCTYVAGKLNGHSR